MSKQNVGSFCKNSVYYLNDKIILMVIFQNQHPYQEKKQDDTFDYEMAKTDFPEAFIQNGKKVLVR